MKYGLRWLAAGAALIGFGFTAAPAHATEPAAGPAAGHRAPLVVSLTFDDGYADQMTALPILIRHNMRATFYVNSAHLDTPGRLSTEDLHRLVANGNEIGGHTTDHANLPLLSSAEQMSEICDDRTALSRAGLTVTDFAYPYGASDPTTERIVRDCGYNSARSLGGLRADSCPGCDYAEQVPPGKAFHLRAAPSVVATTRLSVIESMVEEAEQHAGGWVPLVFHNVCDGCSDMAITPGDLEELLSWLSARSSVGTVVRTVAAALPSGVRPLVSGPSVTRPEAQLVNHSLENTSVSVDAISVDTTAVSDGSMSRDRFPDCWEGNGYGTNTAAWVTTSEAHSGASAESVTISSYQSGDRKLMVRRDTGTCAPKVTAGRSYTLGAWYTSTAPTRFLVFCRGPSGHWNYWTSAPAAPSASHWRQARWTTPPVPVGATALSFGLQLSTVGRLTTDDYSLEQAGGRDWAPLAGTASLLALVPLTVILALVQRRHDRLRTPVREAVGRPVR